MSLQEKLEALREASSKRVPAEAKATMAAANDQLRASGILDTMLSTGQPVPAFSLLSSDGTSFDSQAQLGQGELIYTFFRGAW